MDSLMTTRESFQLDLLRRISQSELKGILAFKGGTALHLIYNMNRFSEDLDFSVSRKVDDNDISSLLKRVIENEEITDFATKRRTILAEIKKPIGERSFRLKIEISTDDIVQGELKTLFAKNMPISFSLQMMRSDWLVGQKIRALIQRRKARDVYDLWFILRTKLPVDWKIISQLTAEEKENLPLLIQERIESTEEKEIITDLNPFLEPKLRTWTRRKLKQEVSELFRAFLIEKSPNS